MNMPNRASFHQAMRWSWVFIHWSCQAFSSGLSAGVGARPSVLVGALAGCWARTKLTRQAITIANVRMYRCSLKIPFELVGSASADRLFELALAINRK